MIVVHQRDRPVETKSRNIILEQSRQRGKLGDKRNRVITPLCGFVPHLPIRPQVSEQLNLRNRTEARGRVVLEETATCALSGFEACH